jgi:hypothetical protein
MSLGAYREAAPICDDFANIWQVLIEDGRPVVSFGDWQAVQRAVTAAVSAAWRSYLPDRLLRPASQAGSPLQPSRHSAPAKAASIQGPYQAPQHSRKRASAGANSRQELRPGAAAGRRQALRPAAGLRSLSEARLVSDTRNTAAVATADPTRPWSAGGVSGGLAARGSVAADTPEAACAAPTGHTAAAAAVPSGARDSSPAEEPMLSWQPRGSRTLHCGRAAATAQQVQPQALCSIPQPERWQQGSRILASRSKHSQQVEAGSEICRPLSAPPHPAKRLKAAHRNPHSSTASGVPVQMGLRNADAAEPRLHSEAGTKGGTPASSAVPQPQRVPLREVHPQHNVQPQQRSDPAALGQAKKQCGMADAGAAQHAALTSVRRRRTSASQPLDWAQPPHQQQEQQRQDLQPGGSRDENGAAAAAHASSGAGPGRRPLSAMVAAWDNPALPPPAAPAVLSVASMAKSDSRLVPKGIAREDLAHVKIIGQACPPASVTGNVNALLFVLHTGVSSGGTCRNMSSYADVPCLCRWSASS